MRICMIAAALIALPVLAACGSDKDTAAPTVTQADLAKSLQDKGLKNKQLADCAAKVFVDQGISQDGLRIMISDEYDTKTPNQETLGMSKEDADKARAASGRIAGECMAAPQQR
ncbi:hypothetical protein IU486_05040 [Streptomyces gardneri]|uniref:hypothetical protein n=1 Tax=Nocardia TaxID=1817 RepID=UPI001358FEC5|nr:MULTISPECIES: hypothetical protein [Nocardia]MBF6164141.1 hypothetical protein [Streptomyces gardneri]MBF6203716.1 hypothetical protein [Streptomyces gardneri]UAK33764.1 hypothetical protein K8O92_07470 [Nocardia asteroides]